MNERIGLLFEVFHALTEYQSYGELHLWLWPDGSGYYGGIWLQDWTESFSSPEAGIISMWNLMEWEYPYKDGSQDVQPD